VPGGLNKLEESKTILVQCDFDGTITVKDLSFVILDAFARNNWKQLFNDYQEGKITLGQFNTEAFSTVKADKESLLALVRKETVLRPGFPELIDYCRRKHFRFVIVSNGLHFYIEDLLTNLGFLDIEIYATQTDFCREGLKVQYIGPDGQYLDKDFKLAFTDSFLNQDYRIIYIGDGSSDLLPAKKAQFIFATGTLLEHCQAIDLSCTPFDDFNQIVSFLESLR